MISVGFFYSLNCSNNKKKQIKVMGGRINIILFLLPSLFTFSYFLIIFSHGTITPTQYITDPQTLASSPDKIFRLGFFSPGNSTNRYVGIWYNNIPVQTIVWVANRDNPLNDSSGVLRIANDGNLVVLNGRGNLLWTTNVSNIASSNSIAELLDSGNLVLREAKGRILWQSFDYPSDTLLPMMEFGVNLRTGEKQVLTSWKETNSDPSTGSFTLELDPYSNPKIIIKNSFDQRHWQSGSWNKGKYLGLPNYDNAFDLHRDNTQVFLNLAYGKNSALSRFVLDSDGKLVERKWDEKKKEWYENWFSRHSECDIYGKCGPFGICNMLDSPICSCLRGFKPKYEEEWRNGNWSGGCVRRTELQCERNKSNNKTRSSSDGGGDEADGFLILKWMKLPDSVNWWHAQNDEQCGQKCLNDCSCVAYSYNINIGCFSWTEDLIDVQKFSWDNGISLCIRVAYSEPGKKKRVLKIIIIITVLIVIVTISVGTYFCWRMAKQRDSCWRWMEKQRDTMHDYYFCWIGRMKKDMSKNVQRKRERKKRKKKKKDMGISLYDMDDAYGEPSDSDLLIGDNEELTTFNFEYLAIATNTFSEANKLGHGGFGFVYKGKLFDGQEIAVKRLSKGSGQGVREFKNEVLVVSKLQHRNLVRLLGCCIEGEEKILVYEYMPNKSLDAFLFDETKRAVLDWRKRFHIIEGISRGILYLHRDSRLRVIHRDLKASNILLDEDLNPKISDFGMARIFGGDELHANYTRRVVGTYGYMSPEYFIEGRFSEKSDVFSFGVLLLEIVSGKKNTSVFQEELSLRLLGCAWKFWNENKAQSLIDPILLSEPSFELEILRCIHVGLLCVQEFAIDRPTMSTTLSMLTSEIATLPTPKQPAFTEKRVFYDSSSSQKSINNVTITSIGGR